MIYQLIDCNFNIDSAPVCNHRLLDYEKIKHVIHISLDEIINGLIQKKKIQIFFSILYFSNTNPTNTQDIVMSKLDKRRKGVYGPPLGKKFIVFVDDINMPDKDDVDSQPSIELLRQLLDHQIWYDSKELFTMKLIEMVCIFY